MSHLQDCATVYRTTRNGKWRCLEDRDSQGLPQEPTNPWIPEPQTEQTWQDFLSEGLHSTFIAVTGNPLLLGLLAGLCVTLALWAMHKFLEWLKYSDLADDAWDVEYYIDELNEEAEERLDISTAENEDEDEYAGNY